MKPIELVEQIETPILLEKSEDGFHRAKFLVTTIGARNKNNRVYPMTIAAREAQYSMRGDILGQDTHPMTTPKFTEQFLIWEKFMIEGDKEYAQAKIVPTKPDGENFILLAQAGAMVSCSRRGVGSVKESTIDGVKCQVVQDDYKLLGIDILPPHTQSDHNAYLYRFEAYDPQEQNNMNDLTLEQLREEREDLVTELTKPLEEKVTELETAVSEKDATIQTLTVEKDAATVLAQETQVKLDEKTAEVEQVKADMQEQIIAPRDAEIVDLKAKLDESTNVVTALTESINARNHLLEKVKGERAAWLILDELKNETTVAGVDAKFDEAKQKCDALIEHANSPAGRAQHLNDDNPELSENGTPAAQVTETPEYKQLLKVARRAGL